MLGGSMKAGVYGGQVQMSGALAFPLFVSLEIILFLIA
jgi:hypothetical protein